jgi:hypothetical protein
MKEFFFLFFFGDGTQGLMLARQALYHLNHFSAEFLINSLVSICANTEPTTYSNFQSSVASKYLTVLEDSPCRVYRFKVVVLSH